MHICSCVITQKLQFQTNPPCRGLPTAFQLLPRYATRRPSLPHAILLTQFSNTHTHAHMATTPPINHYRMCQSLLPSTWSCVITTPHCSKGLKARCRSRRWWHLRSQQHNSIIIFAHSLMTLRVKTQSTTHMPAYGTAHRTALHYTCNIYAISRLGPAVPSEMPCTLS